MRLFKISDTAFNKFDETVRSYLSKTFSTLGMEHTASQVFGSVYAGIKGIMQNIMVYIEDAFTEQNIYTARRKRSLYSLARLSGYDSFYGSAAEGVVVITPALTSETPLAGSPKLFLKDHTTIVDSVTGVMYTMMLDNNDLVIDLSKSMVSTYVKIIQGLWSSAYFTASGEALETFKVNVDSMFDKQYVEVTVNGEKYTQALCLYDMTEDSKEFVVNCGFDSTFEITFGDGVHGRHLNEGDSIQVNYVSHYGTQGNILFPGQERFKFISSGYNSSGDQVSPDSYVTVRLNGQCCGGTNSDSISFVRKMAGYSSRTGVLATKESLAQFLKRFSFIGRCTVASTPGSLDIDAYCMSSALDKVTTPDEYLSLDDSDLLLTDAQKQMVSTSLSNSGKAMAGLTLNISDPVIRKYAAICYVKTSTPYGRDTASASIRNAIAKYFMNLPEGTSFIPKSDIINACTAASDTILSFDFDFISKAAEDAYDNGYYYEYERRLVNGVWKFVEKKVMNTNTSTPGLDAYGNIDIPSGIEMPLLSGGWRYFHDKATGSKDSVTAEAVQVIFI